jgi:hypothetical protein
LIRFGGEIGAIKPGGCDFGRIIGSDPRRAGNSFFATSGSDSGFVESGASIEVTPDAALMTGRTRGTFIPQALQVPQKQGEVTSQDFNRVIEKVHCVVKQDDRRELRVAQSLGFAKPELHQ